VDGNFKLETTTVWSFPERGKWATHRSTATYRGNFAPQVARNLILRYSERGDVVLDPFVGGGTTLVECKILGRRGIGVDINPSAVEMCRNNLNFKVNEEYSQTVRVGDARYLDFLSDESVDLVIAHPPYADAIKYSENLDGDLSLIPDIKKFVEEMKIVAKEFLRVLKTGKHCAILIGDLRRNRHVVPLGFEVFRTFLDVGFIPREIIIKVQHNCRSTDYWAKRSVKNDFLLLNHEYLFVFKKLLFVSPG
jgi:tRNA G10  N-methylase Trm11